MANLLLPGNPPPTHDSVGVRVACFSHFFQVSEQVTVGVRAVGLFGRSGSGFSHRCDTPTQHTLVLVFIALCSRVGVVEVPTF